MQVGVKFIIFIIKFLFNNLRFSLEFNGWGVKHTVNSRNDDLTETVAVIAFWNYDIKIKRRKTCIES